MQSPPATCTGTKSPSPWEAESSKKSPSPGGVESSKKSPSPGEAEPVVKQKPSGIGRMMEGERGDIIHFYNKVSHWWGIDVLCSGVKGTVSWKLTFDLVQVYIGYIKEFALRFQRAADDVSGMLQEVCCVNSTALC